MLELQIWTLLNSGGDGLYRVDGVFMKQNKGGGERRSGYPSLRSSSFALFYPFSPQACHVVSIQRFYFYIPKSQFMKSKHKPVVLVIYPIK